MDVLVGVIIGIVAAVVVAVVIIFARSRRGIQVQTHSSLVEMRSVGELVVFKVVTKEIVTASQHWLGDVGKNYFSWLVSGKKMAMIFEFGIDFKYDLRSTDFEIIEHGEGRVTLKMPRCQYQTYIRDISFYDEQSSKFLPGLLPEVVGRLLGGGFSEEDKNRLKEAARSQADEMARRMVERIESEVQHSAEQTLGALAKGFGARQIAVDFTGSKLIKGAAVDLKALENLETQ